MARCRGGEAAHSPVTGSQLSREPAPLDCEPTSVSQVPPPHLRWVRRKRVAERAGAGYFLSLPGRLGSVN